MLSLSGKLCGAALAIGAKIPPDRVGSFRFTWVDGVAVLGEVRLIRPTLLWHGRIRPQLADLARSAVQHRWLLVVILAAVAAVPFHAEAPLNMKAFAFHGSQIVHGNFADVYADPWNQSGPLQLLLCYVMFAAMPNALGAVGVHMVGTGVGWQPVGSSDWRPDGNPGRCWRCRCCSF